MKDPVLVANRDGMLYPQDRDKRSALLQGECGCQLPDANYKDDGYIPRICTARGLPFPHVKGRNNTAGSRATYSFACKAASKILYPRRPSEGASIYWATYCLRVGGIQDDITQKAQ